MICFTNAYYTFQLYLQLLQYHHSPYVHTYAPTIQLHVTKILTSLTLPWKHTFVWVIRQAQVEVIRLVVLSSFPSIIFSLVCLLIGQAFHHSTMGLKSHRLLTPDLDRKYAPFTTWFSHTFFKDITHHKPTLLKCTIQ